MTTFGNATIRYMPDGSISIEIEAPPVSVMSFYDMTSQDLDRLAAAGAPMMRGELIARLERLGACEDALQWLITLPATYTAWQCWNACRNGAWLVWVAEDSGAYVGESLRWPKRPRSNGVRKKLAWPPIEAALRLPKR